jgi:hypothetical protein
LAWEIFGNVDNSVEASGETYKCFLNAAKGTNDQASPAQRKTQIGSGCDHTLHKQIQRKTITWHATCT